MKTLDKKRPIELYFETHDPKYLTADAEFINMSTKEITVGREAIGQMLDHIYHVAFDARAEMVNKIVTRDKALLEANFIGKHIGEFAGIAPTGKSVNVPLCVSYDLEDGYIKTARIYFPPELLIKQIQSL